MTNQQKMDLLMTAGNIILPDTMVHIVLSGAIISQCWRVILLEYSSPNDQARMRRKQQKRRTSRFHTWLVRITSDMVNQAWSYMESSMRQPYKVRDNRQGRRKVSGNSARWTSHVRAAKLTRKGRLKLMSKQTYESSEEIHEAMVKSTFAMASTTKSHHDGHRHDSDSKPIAIDNCCSKCITNDINDFIAPPERVNTRVQGVGGNVMASFCGTVRWAIEDDNGVAHEHTIPGTYYNPSMPFKLLSPQHLAQVSRDDTPNPRGTWCATYDDAVVLQWGQRKFTRTVPLDKKTNIALIRSAAGYQKYALFCQQIPDDHDTVTACIGVSHDGQPTDDQTPPTERKHPDLPDEVFARPDEPNEAIENVDFGMKDVPTNYSTDREQMLEWHYRLGHLPFDKIREMAKRGDLPSKFKDCAVPMCGACLYAKRTRKAWRSRPSTVVHARKAELPGDIVAIDQMISPTPGLVAQMKGFLTKKRYTAATVFVDHASNLSFTYLQKSLTTEETLEAKGAFERFAAAHGVTVKHYQTDNGIFETGAFQQAVEGAGQTISFAGVNAHHQNGHAEGKIRDLQGMSRAMLLHAAHRWSDAVTANLWPYAMRLANDNINMSPQLSTGLSPMERFTQIEVAPRVKHSHTFGCPVYVLDDRLQTAGGKIHKWKERSRVGLYLGPSPRHSKRVALVLNLQTGHVSPQFHIAFDDNFETIRSGTFVPESRWQAKTGFKQTNEYNSETLPIDGASIPESEMIYLPSDTETSQTNADVQDPGAPNAESSTGDDQASTNNGPGPPTTTKQGRPNPNNQYVTRAGRTSAPTTRWLDSQQQIQDGLVALSVSWEVFHDGGYDIQRELDDPFAFMSPPGPELTIVDQESLVTFAASSNPDVMYMDQALKEPDGENFRQAMVDEVTAHTDNDHWEVVPRSLVPPGTTVLPAVWAMRRKRRISTGEPYKWKARLNVHGGKQELGVNYWETYAPVIAWDTIRLFLILSLLNGWATRQIDFVLAYPQADIECPIYMDIPSQFAFNGSRKTHCLLLKKNLYGQKQAGRVWNLYLHEGLLARGFKQSQVDMCLYYRGSVALLIYTDDGILLGPKPSDLDEIVELLQRPVLVGKTQTHRAFKITDEGTLDEYLGVKVQHLDNGTIKLSQPQLIQQVIDDLGFNERTKTNDSPAASTVRLQRDVGGKPYQDDWHYRSIIGKLNFLEKSTRPDIAYAVHQCARFCLEPKESHATAVKRIGKYLLATKDKGMILNPKHHSFECYVDADFVGNWNRVTADIDPSTAKSRTAFIISYAGCPVSWASKLQTEVALSSTEAEYNALSESLRNVRFMMQVLDEAKELGWETFTKAPTVHCKVFEDNSGALEMGRLPKMRPRTKHLCVRLHHFREHVRTGKISIQHVASKDQLADIATKPQPTDLFVTQREAILHWEAETMTKSELLALATIQLSGCDVSGKKFMYDQLDVYPQASGTQETKVKASKSARQNLHVVKNGEPKSLKRSRHEIAKIGIAGDRFK